VFRQRLWHYFYTIQCKRFKCNVVSYLCKKIRIFSTQYTFPGLLHLKYTIHTGMRIIPYRYLTVLKVCYDVYACLVRYSLCSFYNPPYTYKAQYNNIRSYLSILYVARYSLHKKRINEIRNTTHNQGSIYVLGMPEIVCSAYLF
jgi:hypothetical protein